MFLLFGPKTNSRAKAYANGIRFQTSANGIVIPVVYGTTRLAGNVIWHGDFNVDKNEAGKGGGTSGIFGKGGSGQAMYSTGVAFGVCEGPITSFTGLWNNQTPQSLGGAGDAQLAYTLFLGTYTQQPWGFLTANHPGQDLAYRGLAYVANSALSLGTNPHLPNLTFEVQSLVNVGVAGFIDADPALVVKDILTNVYYGAVVPPSFVDTLSNYSDYCVAAGLLISPAYTEQRPAADYLKEIAQNTNSEFVWSSNLLKVVPYGDAAISANGRVYTPVTNPLYALTDNDLLNPADAPSASHSAPLQAMKPGTAGASLLGPLIIDRIRPAEQINTLKLEYLDRSNAYNPAVIEAKDDAAINAFGLRTTGTRQAHLFALTDAARLSVQLHLGREQVRNQFTFYLGPRFILLDPMDVVSVTDTSLGLTNQGLRIKRIEEHQASSFKFKYEAEEFLLGSGATPVFSTQANTGFGANTSADPGNVNAPIIFEPPVQLDQDPDVWFLLSGSSANWGGADVWLSLDGSSYAFKMRVIGKAKQGTLAVQLPVGLDPDTANTLAVDLTESGGTLQSVSQVNADTLQTLCYVDGELIAYETATLTATSKYNLSYLRRGAYGSGISAHAIGALFGRLDGSVQKVAYQLSLIGKTIYLKFLSFNLYGGGEQLLQNVQPYAYTIKGSLYNTPLPDVTGVTTVYQGGVLQIYWNQVADFRSPIDYEIRQGPTWSTAVVLGRWPAPPAPTHGDGTYWIAAHYKSPTGVDVYSADPTQFTVTGSVIQGAAVTTWDEAATGWSGILGGAAIIDTVNNVLRLEVTEDVLADPNILATVNLFALALTGTSGSYDLPSAHTVDALSSVQAQVMINVTAHAQSIYSSSDVLTLPNLLTVNDVLVVGDDFLTLTNVLSVDDLLGGNLGPKITVTPQIAVAPPSGVFGPFQNFIPGTYVGEFFKARISFSTSDAQVVPIISDVVFTVSH